MINPVFLRTFMNLVQTNHFTKTAQQLSMTQPGVSQHIKKLECELGKALLNRYGKTFELTTAGDSLYQYGLQQAEAEFELLNAIADNDLYAGDCKLACSGSMAMQLYPKLLDLQKQYADITVSVEAAPNAAILDRIKTNQSDIGIVTQYVNDPKLVQQQIGHDTLCLVLPAGVTLTWQTLLELGFINHPDGHHYATQLLGENFSIQFEGMTHMPQSGYINQLSQILLPVSQGLGFTVIPKSSLDVFAYPERIYSAPLTVPINEMVYLITKKHRTLPSRYQLIDVLLKEQWH